MKRTVLVRGIRERTFNKNEINWCDGNYVLQHDIASAYSVLKAYFVPHQHDHYSKYMLLIK